MPEKSPANAIVTYRSFGGAFDTPAPLPRAGGGSPFESLEDPAQDTALRAQLSAALASLEDETLRQGPGMMAAVQNQFASLMQSRMLEQPPPGDLRSLPPVASGQSAFEVKYDEKDILGWVGSVFSWWKKITPEPWLTPADAPDPIGTGAKLRMAMVADWGTGLYGAPVCARSIAQDPNPFNLLVHLGDIYYSGTQHEVRTRFLDNWPRRTDAISRACNANHEMYTGGEGYFRALLPAFKQPASYFALQNDSWVLAGLDSAYVDHDLAGNQVAWLEQIVAKAGDRKVVLFTHHQPYSLLDNQGPKLVEKLGRLLGRKKIFAWYWGHEHRCVLYDKHPAWGLHGRCIGHGGYPYFRDKIGNLPIAEGTLWRRLESKNLVPGAIVLDAPNKYVEGDADKYGANGYVTLNFDAHRLHEVIHEPDGTVLRERELT